MTRLASLFADQSSMYFIYWLGLRVLERTDYSENSLVLFNISCTIVSSFFSSEQIQAAKPSLSLVGPKYVDVYYVFFLKGPFHHEYALSLNR